MASIIQFTRISGRLTGRNIKSYMTKFKENVTASQQLITYHLSIQSNTLTWLCASQSTLFLSKLWQTNLYFSLQFSMSSTSNICLSLILMHCLIIYSCMVSAHPLWISFSDNSMLYQTTLFILATSPSPDFWSLDSGGKLVMLRISSSGVLGLSRMPILRVSPHHYCSYRSRILWLL